MKLLAKGASVIKKTNENNTYIKVSDLLDSINKMSSHNKNVEWCLRVLFPLIIDKIDTISLKEGKHEK